MADVGANIFGKVESVTFRKIGDGTVTLKNVPLSGLSWDFLRSVCGTILKISAEQTSLGSAQSNDLGCDSAN